MAPMSFRIGNKNKDKVLAQVATVCDRVLMDAGVPELTVNLAVVELVSELRENFAGMCIYIPKGRVTKDERAAEVYARHAAGESIADLAKNYGFVSVYISELITLEHRRLQEIRRKADASARRQRTEKHHG